MSAGDRASEKHKQNSGGNERGRTAFAKEQLSNST